MKNSGDIQLKLAGEEEEEEEEKWRGKGRGKGRKRSGGGRGGGGGAEEEQRRRRRNVAIQWPCCSGASLGGGWVHPHSGHPPDLGGIRWCSLLFVLLPAANSFKSFNLK